MRIGDFEIHEPAPDLAESRAIAILSPWIDVGKVGSLVLSAIETQMGSTELGKLARPGDFYDFTRYRPMMYLVDEQRRIKVPNTVIKLTVDRKGGNVLLIHALEPHARGEDYVESTLRVLRHFGVKQYCLIGGMYDSVPHTRPLMVSGGSNKSEHEVELVKLGIRRSNYQGPTTITVLVTEQAAAEGIETITMLARLPNYAQLEEDFAGACTILKLVDAVFGLSVETEEMRLLGEEHYMKLDHAVQSNPQARDMLKAMEQSYDAETRNGRKRTPPNLSPEVERFLRDINKNFGAT